MESFKMLYEHYIKTIYGFCLRMLNHQQDAEDAVQTIFHNLYRNISNFRFKSQFSTYLISITRNVCHDILDKRKNVTDDIEQAQHHSTSLSEFQQDLSTAISRLPERTRECFVLFAVEGYPQEEVASLMNVEVGTVKALVYQARQKLVAWLGNHEE
jgi:RNA polymerase sigma-70 factor (ECF subfamily)